MLESQNEYMAKYITLENIPSKVGSRKEKDKNSAYERSRRSYIKPKLAWTTGGFLNKQKMNDTFFYRRVGIQSQGLSFTILNRIGHNGDFITTK